MREALSFSVLLGTVYTILGVVALTYAGVATMASILVLGVIFLLAGSTEIIYGFMGRRDGALWPHLGLGALAVVCGALILRNPLENTLGLTLVISFLLLASGLTRGVGAIIERPVGWGWMLTSGAISVVLGTMILSTFPESAVWALGTFVGVDLISTGATLVGLGVSLKRFQKKLSSSQGKLSRESARLQRPVSRERYLDDVDRPFH